MLSRARKARGRARRVRRFLPSRGMRLVRLGLACRTRRRGEAHPASGPEAEAAAVRRPPFARDLSAVPVVNRLKVGGTVLEARAARSSWIAWPRRADPFLVS